MITPQANGAFPLEWCPAFDGATHEIQGAVCAGQEIPADHVREDRQAITPTGA
jgi:hypothetical protein